MVGLQPTHLLIIVIVALIFFMPSRLPQLTRAVGRMFTEFREGTQEGSDAQKPKDAPRDAS